MKTLKSSILSNREPWHPYQARGRILRPVGGVIFRARMTIVALALVALAAGCGGASGSGSGGSGTGGQLSIVSLGDSIAAGEGIAYGYTYDSAAPSPHWVGGTPDPTWAGTYQQCHQTTAAYGSVVAQARHARFTNLACTGATYVNGLTGPWSSPGTPMVPAEFGDWDTKSNLNPVYDRAAPDVVLVTFGANDVMFENVLVSCVVAAINNPNVCTAQDPVRRSRPRCWTSSRP